MKFVALIPARYASSRFPGKPLADLLGKPLIQHVYERGRQVFDLVYVATDDTRIELAVKGFGGKSVLTSPLHKSGTDRCAEAGRILLPHGTGSDIIINIQGDEPFIQEDQLNLLCACFKDESIQIATLANPVLTEEELANPNIVKVIRDKYCKALYFSRYPIPYLRDDTRQNRIHRFRYLRHLGIYAYRYPVLQEITGLPQSPLEKTESLEQLRWLENGYPVHVELTETESYGIDTPEDLEAARNMILGDRGKT
jgi:3-deoxy-manno-octulosonate cytidylyltransferase (CMP-KDO synthetase)